MSKQKDDIKKYLKGELTPAEMHKLEMQALHDPFLTEGLEGADLIGPDQFARDIDSINQKIGSRNTKKYFWPLRIAASILLIVSVTYLLVKNNPDRAADQLALQKNASVTTDSLPMKENKADQREAPILPDSVHASNPLTENQITLRSEDKLIKGSAVNPEETKKQNQPQEETTTAESVVMASGASREEKDVISEETKEIELASSQESEKAGKEKIVAAKRRSARSETLKKIIPSPHSSTGKDKRMSKDGNAVSAQPTLGKAEYLKYLRANVKYPTAAIDNHISGEVIVSFIVNSDSTLTDFKIEKGIGYGCDQELIRLIKGGPPWIPATKEGAFVNERTKVSFVFDRPN